MSIEDTIGYSNAVAVCVVCGKNVQNGGGFARLKRGTMLLELCCPLCLETFQTNPRPYVQRLQRAEYFRELAALQNKSDPAAGEH
jgi:hypothetical protein